MKEKDSWRLRFKLAAVILVLTSLLIGGLLAYLGKDSNFSVLSIGVFTFASSMFAVDYFSKPTKP